MAQQNFELNSCFCWLVCAFHMLNFVNIVVFLFLLWLVGSSEKICD